MPAKKKAKTTKKKTAVKKTAKKVAKKAVRKSAPKKAAQKKIVSKKPLKKPKTKPVVEKKIVVPPPPEPAPPPPPPKKKLGIDCDHCDATGICAAGTPYDKSRGQTFGAKVRMTSCVECLEEAGEHKNSKKLVKCRLCDGDGKV